MIGFTIYRKSTYRIQIGIPQLVRRANIVDFHIGVVVQFEGRLKIQEKSFSSIRYTFFRSLSLTHSFFSSYLLPRIVFTLSF